ncbi:MAG: phosphoenolpyruvate synthase [Firmicutes bacterium]|nr:phosphoenolpyruvate synthase [Bacillota bacterium]
MNSYVLGFHMIDKTKLTVVGGKGLNLGELSRIEGIRVPEGFCVTTGAYKKIIGHNQEFNALLDQLWGLKVDDRETIGAISGKIRAVIEGIAIDEDIKEEIIHYLAKLGEENAYAVRSSATAEDLPLASFAGQQDTYLNIKGKDAILQHISKCWASLFTDRAVIYRMQNGFNHRRVYLSVIIQRMVFPQVSGILFTADPVTSNRKVLSVDAGFGLGEAMVSGLVNADIYKVREGRIVDKKVATKELAVYASEEGGTVEREVEPKQQNRQTLTDEQILLLERIGRKIETNFGCPQDIEWCLSEDTFFIVQSRPITTLYPIPKSDGQNRVYMSMGHQQMMTDAIKPLGMSFFHLLSENYPLRKAGGRLFVDLTHDLASPIGRKIMLSTMMGKNDPLMRNAILSLTKRKAFMKSLPRGKKVFSMRTEGMSWALFTQAIKIYRQNNVAIMQELISRSEASIRDLKQKITNVSGDELFAFIVEDHKRLKEILYDPRSLGAMAGWFAANWINKNTEKWLGEKSVADTLSQSVGNNVTSEMGLALLDVADVVRPYPAVMEYFHYASDETFFKDLAELEGGADVSEAVRAYLVKYGMRCSSEIDITRPRWNENPTALIPMILSNIENFGPNASSVRFKQGMAEAEQKGKELLSRLEQLPGGKQKAKKTKKMISVLRNFIGYREYPKYAFIQRYWIYKQALLKEAARLVQKGVIREKEDIYYLSFGELREAVRTNRLDYSIITKRKEEYKIYEQLTPPRLMTSEGEVMSGEYNTAGIPKGALAGLPVSSGIIEGRARVVLKMADADIEDGDILVTAFTDPSWTPVFVSVKGLVTEVGGLMTHGAVIAREYGLPAVVSVENATKLIKDGQRIRVNGTEGYIEML